MWVDYCHANEVACGFEKITGCVSGDLVARDSLDAVVETLYLHYWRRIHRSPIDYTRRR
jgi:hypothetical protein